MKAQVPPEVMARLRAQLFHLALTMFASAAAATLLGAKPVFLFLVMSAGWMASLFLFVGPERPAYWRIAASVLTSVAIMSIAYRYALSPFFG